MIRTGLLLSASVLFALASCSVGDPSLYLEQTEVDVGQVVNGQVVETEIPVRNSGQADLVIESVTTSCGCTSAQISPTTIQPGELGVLTIRFDAGAHGPDANGPVERQIFIASNDPQHVEVEVHLYADVLPPE